jgi:hypothetical protein
VILTGGHSDLGTVSRPGTLPLSVPRAMIEPTRGTDNANRTLSPIRNPPNRSGAGPGSVCSASSKAASLDDCLSPTCSPRT